MTAKMLSHIKVDYPALSLFKALLVGTWHNLSDEKLADSLHRDFVFMNFCEFNIGGNKPNGTTLLRFRAKLLKQNLFNSLLIIINTMLETNQLKLSNGKHVATDAILIQSSRRAKKFCRVKSPLMLNKLMELVTTLSNTQMIKMLNGLLRRH